MDKIESNNRIEMDDDGYYSVIKGDDTPFKVMQITDLHIGGGYLSRHEDLKALSMVKSAINRVKPDIVVITGDLACSKAHLSFSRNNLNSFRIVTTMLENMGVPYAITFGNHDADKKTMFERRGLTDYLVSRKRSLFAITKETKVITGYSNYLVKLRNSDGKINSVLYMLDSNEYTHRHAIKTYDYIHDDQVTWYKESVDRLNKKMHGMILATRNHTQNIFMVLWMKKSVRQKYIVKFLMLFWQKSLLKLFFADMIT